MSEKSTKVKYVSWSAVEEAISHIAKQIKESHVPEVVIAIVKGGLIPARVLVDALAIEEIGFIEVKFYKGIGVAGDKPSVKSIALPQIRGKSVLVVDDVVDSGRTMQLAIDIVSAHVPRSLRSAVLYVKPWSTYIPDYYHAITDEWIIFPWEVCESIKEGVLLLDSEFVKASERCELD